MSGDAGEEASPGTRLRLAREARGLSLESAADSLYLDVGRIRAMEADDLAALGAPVFARGHLRKYADLVGVPAQEVLACDDKRALAGEPSFVSIVDRQRKGHGARRYAWPAGALLLALAVVAAVWWWNQRSPQLSRAASQAETFVASTQASEAQTPAAVSATAEVPAVPGFNFELAVLRDCWIEVIDAGGRQLAFELAPAGSSRQLTGAPPLRVLLGDASAAHLSWQGGVIRIPAAAIRQNVAHFELGGNASVTPLAPTEG